MPPHVFKLSSNWKELSTLLLMLTPVTKEEAPLVKETTLFYFTDNSTAYWIVQAGSSPSPGLHNLVEQIKIKEIELQCQLCVVHVPGVVTILQ